MWNKCFKIYLIILYMIQSVIFDKNKFNKTKCINYLRLHYLQPIKEVHETNKYFRYRINKPDVKKKYKTISFNNGIKYIIY